MALSQSRLTGRVSLPHLTAGRPEGRVRIALASILLVALPVVALRSEWPSQIRPALTLPAVPAPEPASTSRLATLARFHRPIQVTAGYPTGVAAYQFDGGDLGRTDRPLAAGEDPLGPTLDRIAARVGRDPGSAAYRVTAGGQVEGILPASGWALDRETTRDRLLAAIASAPTIADPLDISAALIEVPPAITADQVEAQQEALAAHLEQPLTLRIGDRAMPLPPDTWVGSLPDQTIASGDPVQIDRERFRPLLDAFASHFRRPPTNARLVVRDGRLEIMTPAVAGQEVRLEALIDAIEGRIGSADREIEVPLHEVPAPVRAETLGNLGIQEWLGEGITPYDPAGGDRSHNVERAARHLHGLVLSPGEIFSFNRAIGPATTDNGYRWGWGIAAGGPVPRLVPSEAGGICQVATTLFQAAYWAGLEVVERHPHAFWITKYGTGPYGRQGLDATVDEESGTDLRFRNNTGAHLLIQVAVQGDGLHLQLIGTNPGQTVQVGQPVLSDQIPPDYTVIRQPADRLPSGQEMWLEAAGEGFRSHITRTIRDTQGRWVATDTLETSYAPSRNVLAVGTGR